MNVKQIFRRVLLLGLISGLIGLAIMSYRYKGKAEDAAAVSCQIGMLLIASHSEENLNDDINLQHLAVIDLLRRREMFDRKSALLTSEILRKNPSLRNNLEAVNLEYVDKVFLKWSEKGFGFPDS